MEGISREVEYVFSQARLNCVWPQLHRVLPDHVTRPIIQQIWKEYDAMFKTTTESESHYFLRRSQELFNPLLNEKLKRPSDFPTWNNLLAYALRHFIAWNPYAMSLRQENTDERFRFYPSEREII